MRLCLLFLVLAFSTSVGSTEPDDCARWEYRGLRLGMPLEEVRQIASPALLARDAKRHSNYSWSSGDESISVVVDRSVPELPIRQIHVGTQNTDRRRIRRMVELWGPPHSRSKRDGSKNLAWRDEECDVVVFVDRTKHVATVVTLLEFKIPPKEFFYDPGAASTGFPLARSDNR